MDGLTWVSESITRNPCLMVASAVGTGPGRECTIAAPSPVRGRARRPAMPARTGAQYINGLRAQDREVWLHGERVKDVTTHPALANGMRSIAALYDMQHD